MACSCVYIVAAALNSRKISQLTAFVSVAVIVASHFSAIRRGDSSAEPTAFHGAHARSPFTELKSSCVCDKFQLGFWPRTRQLLVQR